MTDLSDPKERERLRAWLAAQQENRLGTHPLVTIDDDVRAILDLLDQREGELERLRPLEGLRDTLERLGGALVQIGDLGCLIFVPPLECRKEQGLDSGEWCHPCIANEALQRDRVLSTPDSKEGADNGRS